MVKFTIYFNRNVFVMGFGSSLTGDKDQVFDSTRARQHSFVEIDQSYFVYNHEVATLSFQRNPTDVLAQR